MTAACSCDQHPCPHGAFALRPPVVVRAHDGVDAVCTSLGALLDANHALVAAVTSRMEWAFAWRRIGIAFCATQCDDPDHPGECCERCPRCPALHLRRVAS